MLSELGLVSVFLWPPPMTHKSPLKGINLPSSIFRPFTIISVLIIATMSFVTNIRFTTSPDMDEDAYVAPTFSQRLQNYSEPFFMYYLSVFGMSPTLKISGLLKCSFLCT